MSDSSCNLTQFIILVRRLAGIVMLVFVLMAVGGASVRAADVTLRPNQGPVGTSVMASGTGWPAGALVYAFFDQQAVTAEAVTVDPNDPNGRFTLTFCVPNMPPGVHPTFFSISTLPGMYSGPIFTITTGIVNCQAAATCRPAFFIGLRGSGELASRGNPPIQDSLGQTVGTFYDHFKVKPGMGNVGVYGVPYQAIPVPDFTTPPLPQKLETFGTSVGDGMVRLSKFLVGQRSTCPDQRFVIVSYSQGVWAVGEVLAKLDDATLSHIVAVVLLGDPKLSWGNPKFEGFATKFPALPDAVGLPGGGGPRQPSYMPKMINPSQACTDCPFQFRSYCNSQDPICNATGLIVSELIPGSPHSQGTVDWLKWMAFCQGGDSRCQHFMYKDGSLPEEVANWFVERLGAQ